jgi:hypothetical protein
LVSSTPFHPSFPPPLLPSFSLPPSLTLFPNTPAPPPPLSPPLISSKVPERTGAEQPLLQRARRPRIPRRDTRGDLQQRYVSKYFSLFSLQQKYVSKHFSLQSMFSVIFSLY